MSAAPQEPGSTCRNCGGRLPAPASPYCAHCGQETRIRPPTIGEFVQQFGGAYLSTEGALWRTLRLLLTRPGELTRRYLAGQRRHFVLPLRLYLTVSVVVLLAVRALTAANLESEGAIRIESKAGIVAVDLGFGRAGLKDGAFYCEDLPDAICRRLQRRLPPQPEALAREIGALGQRFVSAIGPSMFVLLPCFALGTKLAYLNRRMRYTEHLVFALHVHTFWFIALGLSLLPLGPAEWLVGLAVPVYTWLALGRVYAGRPWPRLLRAVALSMLYGIALGSAMGVAALWALLF